MEFRRALVGCSCCFRAKVETVPIDATHNDVDRETALIDCEH